MTRSLGDLEAHRETGLIADPEISEHQVGWFKGDAMVGKPWKAMESHGNLGIYGYGSIPIHTIFRGMNIHKSQLF
jgi:hypothetical protein